MWNNCIFVLDTNVLLNTYRYSSKPRKLLLKVIESIQTRLWMPHQVGKEFHRHRISLIVEMENSYEKITSILKKNIESTKNEIKNTYRQHPLIDLDELYGYMDKIIADSEKKIKLMNERHPKFLVEDAWLEKLSSIYSGKVGDSYDDSKLTEIIKCGKDRYSKKIPPGYMDVDKDKSDPNSEKPYGDLIIWNQITEYAKNQQKPIIFVTDDKKEDWFLIIQGRNIGPRPELIREMKDVSGVDFYAYQVDRFVDIAAEKYNITIDDRSREEIRDMSYKNFNKDIIIEESADDDVINFFEISKKLDIAKTLTEIGYVAPFKPGEKVKHPVFGHGVVVSCTGVGDEALVTVAIPNVGVKKFVVGYAKLEKV